MSQVWISHPFIKDCFIKMHGSTWEKYHQMFSSLTNPLRATVPSDVMEKFYKESFGDSFASIILFGQRA